MSEIILKICPLCTYTTSSESDIESHINDFHHKYFDIQDQDYSLDLDTFQTCQTLDYCQMPEVIESVLIKQTTAQLATNQDQSMKKNPDPDQSILTKTHSLLVDEAGQQGGGIVDQANHVVQELSSQSDGTNFDITTFGESQTQEVIKTNNDMQTKLRKTRDPEKSSPKIAVQDQPIVKKIQGKKRKQSDPKTTLEPAVSNDAETIIEDQIQETVPKPKKIKLACYVCLKAYINAEGLRSHMNKKHPTEENLQNQSVCHRLNRVEIECKKYRTESKENKTEIDFYKNLRTADIAIKQAQSVDKKKANAIRIGGLNYRNHQSQTNQKNLKVQDIIISNIEEIIKAIIPNIEFSITKTQPYQPKKKKDIIDVYFSKSTDVAKIFTKMTDYCKSKTENGQMMFVDKLLSAATRVRYNILETIGKQLKKKYKYKNWKVQYRKQKPYLIISEKGKDEKMFKFTDALVEYRDLLKTTNFSEAKALCIKYQLKGNDLLQFVLNF